jgi:hypothetical protein
MKIRGTLAVFYNYIFIAEGSVKFKLHFVFGHPNWIDDALCTAAYESIGDALKTCLISSRIRHIFHQGH